MKTYLSKSEAIIHLQARGFTEDFKLFGNDLLWVQEKIFLRPKNFRITEVHRFPELSGKETVIFGVLANGDCTRGILLNHFKSYTDKIPAVINDKLIQMDSNYLQQQCDYVDATFDRWFFNWLLPL